MPALPCRPFVTALFPINPKPTRRYERVVGDRIYVFVQSPTSQFPMRAPDATRFSNNPANRRKFSMDERPRKGYGIARQVGVKCRQPTGQPTDARRQKPYLNP